MFSTGSEHSRQGVFVVKDSVNVSLSKFLEIAKDREASFATVVGVAKSHTRLSDWTATRSLSAFLTRCSDCTVDHMLCWVVSDSLGPHGVEYVDRHFLLQGSSPPRDQTCISVSPALQTYSLPLRHRGSPDRTLRSAVKEIAPSPVSRDVK